MAATTPLMLEQTAQGSEPTGFRYTLGNALIITRREVRDSFRDWRIIAPIVILTFLFPGLAQFVAGRFAEFVAGYGADIIGERTIPFLLMIVGFFPISISLVIALETFVGEKERRSLEPLLSTPLSNTELYIGKMLAAMIPPLLSSYGGMLVYLASLVFGDLAWRPQGALVVQIILLTTVQALVMVTGAVVVSSQTTSTRAANLLASFIIIPVAMLIQGESAIMFLAPDAEAPSGIGALWAIIAGMIIVVILLLRVGNTIFNREELLGRMIDQINLKRSFQSIWRQVVAVDERGTRAHNLFDWYRQGIPVSIKRIRSAILVASFVFLVAFAAGYLLGTSPNWRLNLPSGLPLDSVPGEMGAASQYFWGERPAIIGIVMQNWRILAAASILAIFSFGVGALLLTPAVYVVLGYLLSQIMQAGYNPMPFMLAVLTHGVIEIPVIVVATAAVLKMGAVVTRLPRGMTLGQAWTQALGDTIKLWLAVLLPGLFLAAFVEAYITPIIVRIAFGG
ncbi:MAG: stage II sporulation protein M [Anaerolineae bacterium]|nr:stage II sporulation protein M [Anaerolineae bacterium]